MAYYEIIFGSGFYECCRYVITTDYPTTDYGSLIDCLIDYLKEKKHQNILNWGDCIPDEKDGNMIGITDSEENYWGYDEYVTGGNCGDILLTYGDFRINEISETEIKDAEVIEC